MTDRTQTILRELQNNGRLSVDELARRCSCSAVTVRRALGELQENGQVVRTSGGAIAVDHVGVEVAFPERLTINAVQKQAIAARAAQLVKDNSVVLLDNGSSVYLMADLLGDKQNLTVMTFFLPLVNKLSAHADWRVLLACGQLRPARSDVVGPLTEEFFSRVHADQVFFGADGLDADGGVSTVDPESARLTQTLVKSAGQRILLADSTKLAKRATFSAVGWEHVDRWITDAGVDGDNLEKIRGQNVIVDLV